MSLGNIKTYGSKFGTNYPWQKLRALSTQAIANTISGGLQQDSFLSIMGDVNYDRPSIEGKTIAYVIDDTNSTIYAPVSYNVVGPTITFTIMPAAVNITILYS